MENSGLSAVTSNELYVDDVVAALAGEADDGRFEDLSAKVRRAADGIDKRTAEAYGGALVGSLCEDSSDVACLEALLILGLAHRQVLEQHRIDLVTEGKRLAALFERGSRPDDARDVLETLAAHLPQERSIDHELAGIMRRNGDVDELIDRYLARAEEAVAKRRPHDAIPWLQEVLLLDRSRRDVARMIRDLRYSEDERKKRASKRNVILGVVAVISMLISAVVVREVNIFAEYNALPAHQAGNLAVLKGRHAAIGELMQKHTFWTGVYSAASERSALELEIGELEEQLAQEAREAGRLSAQRETLAEAARTRGLRAVQSRDFEAALRDLQHSLELTDETWAHRTRVEADVEAIQDYLRNQR